MRGILPRPRIVGDFAAGLSQITTRLNSSFAPSRLGVNLLDDAAAVSIHAALKSPDVRLMKSAFEYDGEHRGFLMKKKSVRDFLERMKKWMRRRSFQEGRTLSRMIARDVRRDILIISALRIDEGIITGRVRTTNVLYVSRGLVPECEFAPPAELHIDNMWHWTGNCWGGLEDGTSIVDRSRIDEV